MKQSFKEYVATRFNDIIAAETGETIQHDIIVILGVTDFLDVSKYAANIVDKESFGVDGNASVFEEVRFDGDVAVDGGQVTAQPDLLNIC